MPRRLRDLQMTAHLIELPTRGQLFVALGELADDLIRRVPPTLPGRHGAALLPALTGITVARHLDHYEGLSSERLSAVRRSTYAIVSGCQCTSRSLCDRGRRWLVGCSPG